MKLFLDISRMKKRDDHGIRFGKKLQELLDDMGLKPHDLTKNFGFASSTITGYLQGGDPSYSMVKSIAQALDIPPGYFYSSVSPQGYKFLANCANVFDDMKDLSEAEQEVVFELMKGQTYYIKNQNWLNGKKALV